ncbi:MAG: sigma 54-interacting transcriptional regulator [Gammaproteobacteria bacterium]
MLLDESKLAGAIELQSLVDSHQQPFVIIDRDYTILAANKAYERTYSTSRSAATGQKCFSVSHNNDVPCGQLGEDCPHQHLFEKGEQYSCVHLHYNQGESMHHVRVTAYPLISSTGALYMGEMIEEIISPDAAHVNNSDQMVGKSPAFTACVQQLGLVAASDIPVLLQGETGTGKELAASYVHRGSSRKFKPFITVDCTVLTDSLFEAEVFGHARGAFTGSVGERVGLLEQANGGTLFLDEVGELPASQQAKLLRVLETGKFRRVGGRGMRKTDVRLICASNVHLWEAVQAGNFREDLYYRIACLTVHMPSLRERIEDVEVLAKTLLYPISRSLNRDLQILSGAFERLKTYNYPGNVRELRNILFVAATRAPGNKITVDLIDSAMGQLRRTQDQARAAAGQPVPAGGNRPMPAKAAAPQATDAPPLQHVEAQHIETLIDQYQGNRKQIAAALGISERTLYRKLKKYNLG